MSKSTTPAEWLKNFSSLKNLPSSVLVLSKSTLRAQRAVDTILSEILARNSASRDSVHAWSGERFQNHELAQFREAANSLSLFSKVAVLVVRDADELAAGVTKELAKIVEGISVGVNCIFVASSLAKASPLHKIHASTSAVLELEELKGYDLKRWIEKELKLRGLTSYEPKVVDALFEIGAENPDQIAKLIEQAALYVDGAGINLGHISALFHFEPEANEFELIDSVSQGKIVRAESLINITIRSGKSPFALVALFFRSFSQLFLVKFLQSRGSTPGEIRQILALSPWLSQKYLGTIERYSLVKLQGAIRAIARADSLLKNRSLGAEAVLSELVHEIS